MSNNNNNNTSYSGNDGAIDENSIGSNPHRRLCCHPSTALSNLFYLHSQLKNQLFGNSICNKKHVKEGGNVNEMREMHGVHHHQQHTEQQHPLYRKMYDSNPPRDPYAPVSPPSGKKGEEGKTPILYNPATKACLFIVLSVSLSSLDVVSSHQQRQQQLPQHPQKQLRKNNFQLHKNLFEPSKDHKQHPKQNQRQQQASNQNYKPFGYQSSSSLSTEFLHPSNSLRPPYGTVTAQDESSHLSLSIPTDPSSFVGSIHYDSDHHALYLVGGTYSSIFDGVDVFGVEGELGQLLDGIDGNDGFWWNGSGNSGGGGFTEEHGGGSANYNHGSTGLHPHLSDLGIPDYSPIQAGDCFYAVMALPGVDSENGNELKLVHSRRFGALSTEEACSAVDILFANPSDEAPGGYVHEFETLTEEHKIEEGDQIASESLMEDHTNPPVYAPVESPFGLDGPPQNMDPHSTTTPPPPQMATPNAASTEDVDTGDQIPSESLMEDHIQPPVPAPVGSPFGPDGPPHDESGMEAGNTGGAGGGMGGDEDPLDDFSDGDGDEDEYEIDPMDNEGGNDVEGVFQDGGPTGLGGMTPSMASSPSMTSVQYPTEPPYMGDTIVSAPVPTEPPYMGDTGMDTGDQIASESLMEDHFQPPVPAPIGSPFGPDGPPHEDMGNGDTGNDMGSDVQNGEPTGLGGMAPSMATAPYPTDQPYVNSGPQSRFRALESVTELQQKQYQQQPEHRLERSDMKLTQRSMQNEQNHVLTRSVRLLMAGHVEAPEDDDGYIISELNPGQFDESRVYAFAQQIDVRLPLGNIGSGDGGSDYNLHDYANSTDPSDPIETWHKNPQVINSLYNSSQLQKELAGIVTSGVDARSLLNDRLPSGLDTTYPVALVADPTTKMHYYVAMLASQKDNLNLEGVDHYLHSDTTIGQGANQRSRTDYDEFNLSVERGKNDFFGGKGRPHFGSDYRIVVKKVAIDSASSDCVKDSVSGKRSISSFDCNTLSDAEKSLSSKSYEEENIVMHQTWVQQYSPDFGEDARPSDLLFVPTTKGGVLILAGTTTGFGSAFGTNADQLETVEDGAQAPQRNDLDGFVMKIRTDDGAFSGGDKFDPETGSLSNMHSHRIESYLSKDDIVAGLCSKPLRMVGNQDPTEYIYVVGSTAGVLDSVPANIRDDDIVSKMMPQPGSDGMEAFLMKLEVATMNPVWAVQVGSINPDKGQKGEAYGFGCAVSPDENDVYLTGLVKNDGVVTDFSTMSYDQSNVAYGGSDIFVASYSTSDGSRIFLRQVGSKRDDFPSRGNSITTDRFGNAILSGNTRGSLMRKRDETEYRYGESADEAASDVFVMSFTRTTGEHAPMTEDDVPLAHAAPNLPAEYPSSHPPVHPPASPSVPEPSQLSEVQSTSESGEGRSNASNRTFIAFSCVFVFVGLTSLVVVMEKRRLRRKKEKEVNSETNLNARRRSTWVSPRSSASSNAGQNSSSLNRVSFPNVMVDVRTSASGGWHGVYDQSDAVEFEEPKNEVADKALWSSLFLDDGLAEIENSLGDHDDLGGMDEEDLVQAYNDAMALDSEPEDVDLPFSMPSGGSGPMSDEYRLT